MNSMAHYRFRYDDRIIWSCKSCLTVFRKRYNVLVCNYKWERNSAMMSIKFTSIYHTTSRFFNFVAVVPDRLDCRPFAVSATRSTQGLRSASAAPTVGPWNIYAHSTLTRSNLTPKFMILFYQIYASMREIFKKREFGKIKKWEKKLGC